MGLGEADTGTEVGDDASERMVLPGKLTIPDYARSVFNGMDEFVDRLPAGSLMQPTHDPQGHDHVLSLLSDGLMHLNRHLGMIESLRGLLNLRGTATR